MKYICAMKWLLASVLMATCVQAFDSQGYDSRTHSIDSKIEGEWFWKADGQTTVRSSDNRYSVIMSRTQGNGLYYKIEVPSSGYYEVEALTSSNFNGEIDIVSNDNLIGSIPVEETVSSSHQTSWRKTATSTWLDEGNHVLRLAIAYSTSRHDEIQLEWFKFTPCHVQSAETTMQAEEFCGSRQIAVGDANDIGGGKFVGWIESNDWVEYKIDIPSNGVYNLNARVAARHTACTIKVYSDGTFVDSVLVPQTGNWQKWTTVSARMRMSKGEQTLRLEFEGKQDTALMNLNWFEFEPVSCPVTFIGLIIEAKDYCDFNGNRLVDINGGNQAIGFVEADSWAEYDLEVTQSEVNEDMVFFAMVSSNHDGGTIEILVDEIKIGTLTVTHTGGWSKYTVEKAELLPIPTVGVHTLRLNFLGSKSRHLFNLARFALVLKSDTKEGKEDTIRIEAYDDNATNRNLRVCCVDLVDGTSISPVVVENQSDAQTFVEGMPYAQINGKCLSLSGWFNIIVETCPRGSAMTFVRYGGGRQSFRVYGAQSVIEDFGVLEGIYQSEACAPRETEDGEPFVRCKELEGAAGMKVKK